MTLKFCDIPLPVWQAVRNKWAAVLGNGWHDDTWQRCAMCDFTDEYTEDDTGCEVCPLFDYWCGDTPALFLPGGAGEVMWRENVARFIRMCDKIIKKLEANQ